MCSLQMVTWGSCLSQGIPYNGFTRAASTSTHQHSFCVTSGFCGHHCSQAFPGLCPEQSPSQKLVSFCEAHTLYPMLSPAHTRRSLNPALCMWLSSHFLTSKSMFQASKKGISHDCRALCQSSSECLYQATHGRSYL